MNFIRPEMRAEITRWRDVAIGVAVASWGAYWALTSFGLIKWLGYLIAVIGLAYAWSSIQRARFNHGHGGLGIVQLDERQITYLAPVGGGFVALDEISRVEIGPDRAGLPVWRFYSFGAELTIPTSAEGTEALFDALGLLPGIDMQTAIRASGSKPKQAVVIWRKKRLTSI